MPSANFPNAGHSLFPRPYVRLGNAAGSEWKRALLRRGPTGETASETERVAGPEQRDDKLARLEAALFVANEALTTRRLVQTALLTDVAEARELIERLNEIYDRDGTAFRIERVGSGFRLLTRSIFARWLKKLHHREAQLQLSPPALETLTIIAYRQPIKRADVEALRGVQSAEMIKLLMERGLVRIGGEEDSLGRPYLYITTKYFLEAFGLRSLDDLPDAGNLRRSQAEINAVSEDLASDPDGEETEMESPT